MSIKYTLKNVGCYVDSARGIYAVDKIISFAESHGFKLEPCNDGSNHHEHQTTSFPSRFAGCEFAYEVEDEADNYMNENFSVEGAYWGRNENGDWGLWEVIED